jgi:hypothetical protein
MMSSQHPGRATDPRRWRTQGDRMPEKLADMKELFIIEAAKYNAFPIDDRTGLQA